MNFRKLIRKIITDEEVYMCSPKTMLKIGLAIGIPLAVGFIALPQMRVAILGIAPFAIFALCPLGMIFGMKGMMGDNKDGYKCSQCGHIHEKDSHNKAVVGK